MGDKRPENYFMHFLSGSFLSADFYFWDIKPLQQSLSDDPSFCDNLEDFYPPTSTRPKHISEVLKECVFDFPETFLNALFQHQHFFFFNASSLTHF